MTRHETEQAIARDLDMIAIIEAYGDHRAKAKARRHRKAIEKQIRDWNRAEGLDKISDDDLYAELSDLR